MQTYKTQTSSYPIIRCSTIFIPILAFFFIKELLGFQDFVGIVIVLAGIFVLHIEHLRHFKFTAMHTRATAFALFTAFLSACYSIVDKIGIANVDPFTYEYLREVATLLFFTPLFLNKNNLPKGSF